MTAPATVRVLLVEDSEEDAFFFERALRRTGVTADLSAVTDGGPAIEFLKNPDARPDMVFLDLKLPVLSGFDVLRWIEKQKFEPQLNVAVLSGSDQERDVVTAKALGALAYIVKPIAADRLKSLLINAVNRSNGESR